MGKKCVVLSEDEGEKVPLSATGIKLSKITPCVIPKLPSKILRSFCEGSSWLVGKTWEKYRY